jgi:coenzyme F420-0:L-glutamate ligase/coenzyme F420-1:gamma-L-glutamate ligase
MEVHAVKVRAVDIGEDLVRLVLRSLGAQNLHLQNNDVLAFASKIISYAERRLVRLGEIDASQKAAALSKEYCLKPAFAELILREANEIYGGVDRAVLTLKNNVLVANAGIDNKNTPDDFVVLWPNNPKKTAEDIRDKIKKESGKSIGVLIVDSGLIPLRTGTTGLALAVAGFNPIRDYRRTKDLCGKEIVITRQDVADDLASTAHLMMGEGNESTPVVLIRDAPAEFNEGAYDAGEMMIPYDECIFMNAFLSQPKSSRKR